VKVLLTSITLILSSVALAQDIKIESVSEHHKLSRYQDYQNNPASGYLESVTCDAGWKFIVIKGELANGIKLKGKEIYIETESNNKHYPVGCLKLNGIPFLDYRGYSRDYEGKRTPIFALAEKEVPKSLYLAGKEIKLPPLSPDVKITFINPNQMNVISARYKDALKFEHKLAPADKDWLKEALPHFKTEINPVSGKLLYVDIEFTKIERFDCKELSVFSEAGFSSIPVGFKREGRQRFNPFGSITSKGKHTFVFIAPKKQKNMKLFFRNREVCAFDISPSTQKGNEQTDAPDKK
jgi:hypothetical protein